MPKASKQNKNDAPVEDISTVEAALLELEELETIDNEVTDEVVEDLFNSPEDIIEDIVVNDGSATLTAAEVDELDLTVERSESYEEQTAVDVAVGDDGSLAKADDKKVKSKKAAGTKAPAKPRAARELSSVDPKFFVLRGDTSAMSHKEMEDHKAAVIADTPTQVKVAEKFENLITAMSVGRKPSKYVMTAYQSLKAKGTLTSGELVGALQASGVGEGTARSQSGQIMVLFPVLGIATKADRALTIDGDSNIAAYLDTLSTTA